ncbi:MAG: AMP-binding protein [Bacteroidales bacterium]|nr:AMP-binding protein [Bacteroidales bacterium]
MVHYFSTLKNSMAKKWDSPALANFGGEKYTFAELAIQIEKLHIFFDKAGIKKGDKIALCANNSARWAMTFLATTTYEAVIVPLLSEFHPENIGSLVDHSESVILFTDAEHWKNLDIKAMPKIRAAILIGDYSLVYSADADAKAAFEAIEPEYAAKYPNGMKPEDVNYPVDNGSDLSVINYTSGTTSAPKGVMLRNECISASVDFAIRKIPVGPGDKNIVSMLPMGHIYGLVFEFIYPLCDGWTVYYLGKAPSPSLLLKAVQAIKPRLVITVPLVMEKIYNSSIKPKLSTPMMKVLTSIPGVKSIIYKKVVETVLKTFGGNVYEFIMGGAALNPDVEKAFRKMGLPYTVGYGMTEAAPLLAYEDYHDYAQGSCGHYVDYAEVRIDSEDPINVVGEIQAKGINICSGYFNNPEASANAFTEDGFLHTGDLGVMDAKGNIFIRGRSKNMILSANGQNIYPEEVEAVLNADDYVIESVVVDRASKLVGLILLDQAAIEAAGLDADTVAKLPETIRKAANKKLPSYSQITKMEVVDKPFEKTPKMSIKRFMYK